MLIMAPRRKRSKESTEPDAAVVSVNEEEAKEAAKKRLRNRLSQRHFRERKSLYIKQLEERTKESAQSESMRNKRLVDENAGMRAMMLDARSQAFKLSSSLYDLGVELGNALNIPTTEESGATTGMVDVQDSPADTGNVSSVSSSSQMIPSGCGPAEDAKKGAPSQPMSNDENEPVIDSHVLFQESTNIIPESVPDELALEDFPLLSKVVENGAVLEESAGGFHKAFSNFTDMDNSGASLSNQFDLSPYYEWPSILAPKITKEEFGHFGIEHFQSDKFGIGPSDATASRAWDMFQGNPIAPPPLPRSPSGTDLSIPKGLYPSELSGMSHSSLKQSLSSFSLHIETLEMQARCQLETATDASSRKMLYRTCSAIMSLFVQNAWPDTTSVWFKSQVPEIIGPILLWRIHPTTDHYQNLPPDYRPSALQLSVPHSAIIDWIPYPALRDRIISLYNNSATLDRLLCDMVDCYVIEVEDLSSILSQAPSGRAYVGVWNMFTAIDAVTPDKPNDNMSPSEVNRLNDPSNRIGASDETPINPLTAGRLSAIDIGVHNMQHSPGLSCFPKPYYLVDILKTPSSVLKLSQNISLHAAQLWRFDSALFEKYPELKFDGYENIIARGRSCRISAAPPQGPKKMSESTMKLYQMALRGFT